MEERTHEIPIDSIIIGDRQRKNQGDIESLKFSIAQYGLLQPIVVEELPGGMYSLLCGGRRIKACKTLKMKTIPAKFRETLSKVEQQEIELEENLRRHNLNWQEESIAIKRIFDMKRSQNRISTPTGITQNYSQADLSIELNMSQGKVNQGLQLADALDLYPELYLSMSRQEAMSRLRKLRSGKTVMRHSIMSEIEQSFIESEALPMLKKLEDNCVDMLVTDVSKGIDPKMIAECLRVVKPFSYNYFFYKFEQHPELDAILKEHDVVHPVTPAIWHKRETDDYQTITWFSKEAIHAPKHMTQLFSYREDPRNIHDLAKPYQLYHSLVIMNTLKGQYVVDPCTYDINLVKVCLDNDRSVLAACPHQVLREAWILNIKE